MKLRYFVFLAVLAAMTCPCPPAAADTGTALRETLSSEHPPAVSGNALQLTMEEALLMAFENNRSLIVERLNPELQKTYEMQEASLFDPLLRGEAITERTESLRLARAGSGTESLTSEVYEAEIVLEKYFPSGTRAAVGADTRGTDSTLYRNRFFSTRLGLTLTQSLLQGFGPAVNLAALRQAELETAVTRYELRGFAEQLVADVETAYWDFAMAQRQIEIMEESLKLARQQRAETKEMITVGTMAEAELAAVQAEVASQQQGLINARSSLEAARLQLLKRIHPPGENFWNREVLLIHPPTLPDVGLDTVETHVASAVERRPEMNQARLEIQKEAIEIVRTRNGLLPVMDLFVTLGKSGYANTFSGSMRRFDDGGHDFSAGLEFEYSLFRRDAKSAHQRARLQRDQADRALENLAELVELDVRTAYLEVGRTREQIDASSATRAFQAETLRIETEKFRVGRSTNFFVAQAQRDLLRSRIDEVRAVVNYLKALTDFFRLEGTLLERRGITLAE